MNTLETFFLGPWTSLFFAGNMLDLMARLILASLAALVAFRAGLFNLGIEGQIYCGGLVSGALLLNVSASSPAEAAFFLILAALLAIAAGGLTGALCGALKLYTGANEIISSFLLASALNPVCDYFILGPLRNSEGNLLATKALPESFILKRILLPSNLSLSFFIALLFPVIVFFIINRTAAGYRFRIAGASPDFARYGSIKAEKYWVPSMAISGALGALCGFFAVTGTYGIVHQGFSGGVGWAGIACALIAANCPLAVLPAALFYAWLRSGTELVLLTQGLSFDATQLIEATLLILVGASGAFHPVSGKKQAVQDKGRWKGIGSGE
jgi:simple sugar transport system permease protein